MTQNNWSHSRFDEHLYHESKIPKLINESHMWEIFHVYWWFLEIICEDFFIFLRGFSHEKNWMMKVVKNKIFSILFYYYRSMVSVYTKTSSNLHYITKFFNGMRHCEVNKRNLCGLRWRRHALETPTELPVDKQYSVGFDQLKWAAQQIALATMRWEFKNEMKMLKIQALSQLYKT